MPFAAKVCDGLRCVEVEPSPNFHNHAVGAPPVEVSEKVDPHAGERSDRRGEANAASGAAGRTVTVRWATLEPWALVAVSRTT